MASVNRVILIGNLGRDPEIRYTQAGEPIANFSLATTEKWTGKDGNKQERTDWHRVEVFGKTAQVVRDYCRRAAGLRRGQHPLRRVDGQGRQQANTTEIRVSGPQSRLVLLGSRGDGGSGARWRRWRARRADRCAGRRSSPRRLPGVRRRRAVLIA